jgi:immune inhibitor A
MYWAPLLSVTLPSGSASLTAQVRYNIEQDWDYAYVTVNGNPVVTNLSTETSPNGQNFGHGITGVSSSWTTLTADLSAYAGQTVEVGFRYWTDGAQQGTPGVDQPAGFQVDEIAVGGSTDGAEAASTFTLNGFRVTSGTETQSYFNAYVAENRQYLGYDAGLKTGPYNFGGAVGPNWAERFPYQDGMLVWYWDTSRSDNNVGDHPGSGLILPIDAHPTIMRWSDGTQMRPRIQSFDSTFGLQATDAFTLWKGGVPTQIASQPAVSTFDDTNSYYTPSDASDAPGGGRYQASWNSVDNPHTGTQIRVKSVTPGGFMESAVTPPN